MMNDDSGRLTVTLLFALLIQFCALFWLHGTLRIRAKALNVPFGSKPPKIPFRRIAAAFAATAVYLGCACDPFRFSPVLILIVLIQIASVLDIWIEVIPFEVPLLAVAASFLVPAEPIPAAIRAASFVMTAALLLGVWAICRKLAGRAAFAPGDILFGAAYGSAFGFDVGAASFALGLVLAGGFAVCFGKLLKGKTTVPLAPFICLAHAAIIRFRGW